MPNSLRMYGDDSFEEFILNGNFDLISFQPEASTVPSNNKWQMTAFISFCVRVIFFRADWKCNLCKLICIIRNVATMLGASRTKAMKGK